jgi:hypothetical protein
MGELAIAESNLSAALGSPDPFIRYVAHLMLGVTADKTGRRQDVLAHYRAAYTLFPAQAASIALAAALHANNQSGEAAEVDA